MNPTFENAIEIIKALPMPEREKFFDWAEEEKHKEQAEKAAKKTKLKDEHRKFELAMKWLEENRQKYLGKWVCLDGDKLIAFGADGLKIYQEAKAKGIEVPFVEHIVEENEVYGGGIEACPQL